MWSYAVTHDFAGGNAGYYPASGVHRGFGDASLFSATAGGGGMDDGTVCKLSEKQWRLERIGSLCPSPAAATDRPFIRGHMIGPAEARSGFLAMNRVRT